MRLLAAFVAPNASPGARAYHLWKEPRGSAAGSDDVPGKGKPHREAQSAGMRVGVPWGTATAYVVRTTVPDAISLGVSRPGPGMFPPGCSVGAVGSVRFSTREPVCLTRRPGLVLSLAPNLRTIVAPLARPVGEDLFRLTVRFRDLLRALHAVSRPSEQTASSTC
jgi:hypothetical protein